MRPEIHWLLHFCLENQLLTEDQIHGMVSNLAPSTDVRAVAKLLTNSSWVTDTTFLESAVEASIKNTQDGFELPAIPGVSRENTQSNVEGFPDFSTFNQLNDDELRAAIRSLFTQCQKIGASDLHLTGGARPRIRHHRRIVYLSNAPLTDALARRINYLPLTPEQRQRFETDWDLDYALTLDAETAGFKIRFRANLMEQKKGISGVYRIVADHLMSLEELGFSNADNIRKLLNYHNGIILVTGPVGSGKTTTLASLVNELNQTRKDHIITVEDPIEVMQQSVNSIVTQRQVGKHTESFKSALKSALREDPDIIVIGEMRDLETIEMAVTAAETGHLVIATMHTRDAASTLNRMLDVFPPRQQNQIRAMTAESLRGIVSQLLCQKKDGGRIAAHEILLTHGALPNCIRTHSLSNIRNIIDQNQDQGMVSMDASLSKLLEADLINKEEAYMKAIDKTRFIR